MPWSLVTCPAAVNVPRPLFKCYSGRYLGAALAAVQYSSAFMLKLRFVLILKLFTIKFI